MKAFTTMTSSLVHLPYNDVDTDQIIPAAYLKVTNKDGLAEGLFSRWRYLPDGRPDPGFALNRPDCRSAQILLAGDNFGCGSSREHAPWALLGYGFRVIISTSFADIFRNNALKNGLLPVAVTEKELQRLAALAASNPAARVTVDLQTQAVTLPDGHRATFHIDAFSKKCLLEGIDQLGYLLQQVEHIEAFEEANSN